MLQQPTNQTTDSSPEPDWIGLWAAPLRAQAHTITRRGKISLCEQIAEMTNHVLKERKTGLEKCNETHVMRWLNGEAVPEQEAMRDALYMALGLRYTAETNGHRVVMREAVKGGREEVPSTDDLEALVTTRASADQYYENAVLEMLTRDEAALHTIPRARPANIICGPRSVSSETNAYQQLFGNKKAPDQKRLCAAQPTADA